MSARANRRVALSQNFLRSPRLVERLLDRAGLAADDLVVEIGPGRGVITAALAARCRQVLAVEKDRALVAELGARFGGVANVALFAADALDFPLPVTEYKVFASIPFNRTAAIVGKLTSGSSPPRDAHLVVQKEAAQRFLGEPRETLVALLLKPWFAPSVEHAFRPTDFAPPPAVDAVLLRLRRRQRPLVPAADAALYGDLLAHAFAAWQPTVRAALAAALPQPAVASLAKRAGVPLDRPPSALPVEAWVALTVVCRDLFGDAPPAIRGARERLARQQAGLAKEHRTRTPRSGGRRGR